MGSPYPSHILQGLQSQSIEETFAPSKPGGVTALLSDDSKQLLTAWKAWRGDRLLPHRRDMDLVSIARLMPKLVLLEIVSPERMVFRLAGTEIEAAVGIRLMGRDYIALAQPEHRSLRAKVLWAAAGQPCGVVVFQTFPHPGTGRPHQSENFALPILPNDADAPIQLICVASRLPALEAGIRVPLPLNRTETMHQFIDIGGGLPPV
jgi:hypothetical protein